ncbi:MAG: hypothetical protein IKG87_05015 [Clostridia bacterium]|nr:hypothetical protein [Clostridia bacterium]
MALYRKEVDYKGFRSAGEQNEQIVVVPKMFRVVLAGVLIMLGAVIAWSVFGRISDTVAITGIYHPGTDEPGEIIAYVPLATGKAVEPGMPVSVTLVGFLSQYTGTMHGEITYVEEGVSSTEEVLKTLGDPLLTNAFLSSGPVVKVVVQLRRDESSPNGYYWTHKDGQKIIIHDYTFATMQVVVYTRRPISLALSALSELFD